MDFKLDHSSSVPLQAQVESMLRKLIDKPEYLTGKLLPKEVELAKSIGVSRTLLRLVICKLVHEGRLVRKKREGTKVVEPSAKLLSKNWLSFYEELVARSVTVRNFEIHVTWVINEEKLANFFNVGLSEQILKVELLYGNLERPFVYSISFFNPRIGLKGNEDFTHLIYDFLESEHSVIAKVSKEEISAKASDKFISDKLDVKPGTPILFRKRYVFDQVEQPIEYYLEYRRSDSIVYTVCKYPETTAS
ncbi:GntR family transcriptional regulator [Dyadobacter sp. CY347]|uniref:GntR family transcriptional regulator n=1 Tax=Dyadobacter sp. CY347 TaxID=2909336 RepID=UPI001F298945|nr:GntR family transcriptional regulator [Dyadobacter sp. CY347]MCF2491506.1 GntR family transcriptional regulator [Dyadobacter sp. CY347]